LVEVSLVVSGGRILRGAVLWIILAIVLWVVVWILLAVVLLLWVVALLFLLSVASERRPKEAPLGWRGILVRVNLLLVMWDNESHVGLSEPPSPVHSVCEEDRKYDDETCSCDRDAYSGAQTIPANIIDTIGSTVSVSHHGRR